MKVHLVLRGSTHSQNRAGFIDRVLAEVQKVNHMSVHSHARTIPTPAAAVSVFSTQRK